MYQRLTRWRGSWLWSSHVAAAAAAAAPAVSTSTAAAASPYCFTGAAVRKTETMWPAWVLILSQPLGNGSHPEL